MKKLFSIIILLGMVAAAGAYLYVYQPFSKTIQPAELLPEETLVAIEAMDVKKSLDEFRAGPLGQAIAGIDLPEAMRMLKAKPEEIAKVRHAQLQLKEALDSPWFDTLFGDMVTFALLKPDLDRIQSPSEEIVFKSALIVVRPKQPAEMMQWVGKMFSGEVNITTETIEGIEIDKIKVDNQEPIYIAVNSGLGLIALSPAPILRCLKPDSAAPSKLINAPEYSQFRSELVSPGKTRFFSYIDLHEMINTLFAAAAKFEPDETSIGETQKIWNGFNKSNPIMAAVYTENNENEAHSRWLVHFNADDLPPHIAEMINTTPQKNNTLERVPEKVLYYSWQNNLKKAIDSSLEFSDLTLEQKKAVKQEFEKNTGISYDEAVNALGEEFAIVVRDILTGGMFPVPELALMVQVNRPEIIDRLVDNAMRDLKLPLETKEENGVRIRHVILPYGEDISPGYGCTDGFCIFSSNLQLLKTMLINQKGEKRLADTPLFKKIDKGLSEPNNQMAYIHIEKGLSKAKLLVKWGLSFAMMSGKAEDADQLKYLADKVIEPLINGLSMYQVLGVRSFIEGNRIQSDIYVGKSSGD